MNASRTVPVPVQHDQTDNDVLQALTARQQEVLRIVTEEYIAHVQPVGSRKIARDWNLGVSPATIRNDLAHLERQGLLTKHHVSSGRLPTLRGYRLYVARLMRDQHLSPARQEQIQTRFDELMQEPRYWLQNATQLLSSASHSLALATELQYMTHRFKHVQLIAVHERQILVVLVTEEGRVHQQMLEVQKPMAQTDLSSISQELNDALAGLDETAMRDRLPNLSVRAKEFGDNIQRMMPVSYRDVRLPGLIHQGLGRILEAPEFAESNRIRRVIEIFDSRPKLDEMLLYTQRPGDVQVFIAGDGREEWADLVDVSMVLSRYGIPDRATGIVGVVGPVRMAYGYNMSMVRFIATLMSAFVRDTYIESSYLPDLNP